MHEKQHLLTPLDWSIEAHARASRLTGTKEGELAMVEYRRYVLMHEYMESVKDEFERLAGSVNELRNEIEQSDRQLMQAKAQLRDAQAEVEQLRQLADELQRDPPGCL